MSQGSLDLLEKLPIQHVRVDDLPHLVSSAGKLIQSYTKPAF